MFNRDSVNFTVFSMALDAAIVAVVLALSPYIRTLLGALGVAGEVYPPFELPGLLFVLFPIVWVALLTSASVYDLRRNYQIADELTSLTYGSLIAAICLMGMLYVSYREVSRLLFLSFAGLTYFLTATWRVLVRLLIRSGIIQGLQIRRVVIVGAGEIGHDLSGRIMDNPNLGLKLVGFLNDELFKGPSQSGEILGNLDDLSGVIERYDVDDVVLALPLGDQDRVNVLVSELHNLPVKVWVIPSYFALALYKADVADFAGIMMLDLRAPALNEYQRLSKRIFDLLVTLISLPLSLPFMVFVSAIIRLDSPGPVILHQQRVGENGRLFMMYKFRTMVKNADELRYLVEYIDENGNLIHKAQDDPRVTRVGRILRSTSLDELPQLFNVLRGDMSLVGPRPELPYLVKRYETWQRKRFAVPQGITGWWQVNGRSDRPMHLHTEDDLFYVQNYSMWLDLQILLKTIWVALTRKGAF
jgi:exopolysaccharide biosynthesis polyprenyl glycosylphosphotransferase